MNRLYWISILLLVAILCISGTSCKKNSALEEGAIIVDMGQTEFSLNQPGTVDVVIQGSQIDRIITDSIDMTGDNPQSGPIRADSAIRSQDSITASFDCSRVKSILLNPQTGSIHTVTIGYYMEGQAGKNETATSLKVGEDQGNALNPDELELQISPAQWNMNYSGSSGLITAFIRGGAIDQIDLDSLQLQGDNSASEPLNPVSATFEGDHVKAKFAKNQVLDLLLNPAPGTIHLVTVIFMEKEGTEPLELSTEITIEEEDEDPVEPGDLELQISPSEWNLNYTKSSGTVTAFIRGGGIESIDLDSLILTGDNPASEPLEPVSVTRQGDHVKAKFAKNSVLDLLLNPVSGSTHTVTVTFSMVGESGSQDLSATITVVGKSD